jgi:hypothetical protein
MTECFHSQFTNGGIICEPLKHLNKHWTLPILEKAHKFVGLYNSSTTKQCSINLYFDDVVEHLLINSNSHVMLQDVPKYMIFETFTWCYALYI